MSEGRGTTMPFELIGAPWLNVKRCIEFLNEHRSLFYRDHAGSNFPLTLREHHFRPTFNKYMGQQCHGLHFGILQDANVNLFALGMCFLYYCNLFHKEDFHWTTQKYEYNFSDLPINLILGTDAWEKMFTFTDKNCDNLKDMLIVSDKDAQNFAQNNQDIFIYD